MKHLPFLDWDELKLLTWIADEILDENQLFIHVLNLNERGVQYFRGVKRNNEVFIIPLFLL